MDSEMAEKIKVLENLKNASQTADRSKWIKSSFWAPENTPTAVETLLKEPSKKLKCPATNDQDTHSIKVKELIKLKL